MSVILSLSHLNEISSLVKTKANRLYEEYVVLVRRRQCQPYSGTVQFYILGIPSFRPLSFQFRILCTANILPFHVWQVQLHSIYSLLSLVKTLLSSRRKHVFKYIQFDVSLRGKKRVLGRVIKVKGLLKCPPFFYLRKKQKR